MLSDSTMQHLLSLLHVERFDQLARMFKADPEQVGALAGNRQYLTDDKPVIEYFATLAPAPRIDLSRIYGDRLPPFVPERLNWMQPRGFNRREHAKKGYGRSLGTQCQL